MASILDYLFPPRDQLEQDARDREAREKAIAQLRANPQAAEVAQDVANENPTQDQTPPQMGAAQSGGVQAAAGAVGDPQVAPQVTPQVPPQLPPPKPVVPAPGDQTPSVPQAMAAPTVLQPPLPVVPPSATPAPANDGGILGRLFNDKNPDGRGLTSADKWQMGFGTLAQMGALWAASGMPMPAPQRAQYVAAMGNVPGQNMQMAQEMIKQRAGAQQLVQNQQKLDALNQVRASLTPEMLAGLNPAQQALLKASFMTGDLRTPAILLDPNKNRAKIDTNGNISTPDGRIIDGFGRTIYDPRNPTGTGTAMAGNQQKPIGYDLDKMQTELQRSGLDGSALAQIEKEYGPATAQQVFSMATYKQPLSVSARTGALNNPTGRDATIMHLVQAVNPNFSTADFANKQKVWNEFYGTGKTAKNITALDTAYGHIGSLYDAAVALKTGNNQMFNQAMNTFDAKWKGDPRQIDYQMAANAVSHEMAKVFRDAGMSNAEIEEWQHTLGPNLSPAQMQAAITRGLDLMQGRVDSLQTQYSRAGFGSSGMNWFTPSHTEKAEYIKSHPIGGTPAQAGPTQAPNPSTLPIVRSPADAAKLPSGTWFRNPNGEVLRAP
jgi:hypothetical protein